jgi:hypothetical protein
MVGDDAVAGGSEMPEELPFNPVAILGAAVLLGGAVGLLRWLDAWAPRGGLERTYGGFLLVNLAAVLPELAVAATALGLGDFRMAEGAIALCGLLATALPAGRNPLLPGRSLANLLPAVAVVVCILALVAAIFRAPNPNDPIRKALAGAMMLVPYLGCLWLVWRSGLESKGQPPAEPEADLPGSLGTRPGSWWALGAVLAIGAGGALLAWAVHGSLWMATVANGSNPARASHARHVLSILGAFLALPGASLAWHDRRREATSLRPTRELLACPTLVVLSGLMGLGPRGGADVLGSLAILGVLAGGALAVLFASVERFVPVQVRGLAISLTALGMLMLAWRS